MAMWALTSLMAAICSDSGPIVDGVGLEGQMESSCSGYPQETFADSCRPEAWAILPTASFHRELGRAQLPLAGQVSRLARLEGFWQMD